MIFKADYACKQTGKNLKKAMKYVTNLLCIFKTNLFSTF